MDLTTLLAMVESGLDDRQLLTGEEGTITGAELARLARCGASVASSYPAVAFVGENHPLLPVALFAAACAGVPFVPLNYRLDDRQLNELIARQPGALVLTDSANAARVSGNVTVRDFDEWIARLPDDDPTFEPVIDDDAVAVVLFTSGTTAAPKSALLRHRHLMAYLLHSVEFGGADPDDGTLVAVPPYHVAGLANMLSNIYAGRRLVYMRSFDPVEWLRIVRDERVTNAMVVPTMLARIVGTLDGRVADAPTLRTLSYGGAKVSEQVIRSALTAFPNTGFVNAYGLTETASTIALLGPDDHRAALRSDDPSVQRRLSSAGRVLPAVEVEIRDDDGEPLPPGHSGLVYVRGEQIAGEYATGSLLDDEGWFCTRDHGWLDEEGYLFIGGRVDDTIIRGGENIAPSEVEDALMAHPAVAEACVFGIPDDEWGERIGAVVVLRPGMHTTSDQLRDTVRERLRGSKTPDMVEFWDSLPHTDTGKLLRRNVRRRTMDAVA